MRYLEIQLMMIYILSHVFFLLASAYIYEKLSVDITKKVEYIFFRALIVSYQMYLITEAVWSLQQVQLIHLPRVGAVLASYFFLASAVITAYIFYIFTIARMGSAVANTKWFRILTSIPVFIQLVVLTLSVFYECAFSISENGLMEYGKKYYYIPNLSIFYLFVVLAGSLKKTLTSRSYVRRKTYLTQFASALCVMGCVYIDSLFEQLSILPMAMFGCVLTIFINLQESGIYGDVLTGMNNRRKANEYLGEQLMNVTEKNPLYVYMCDINYFKTINDTQGHAEGDRALILTAMVLKKTISKYQGFAARYGGDEFILGWRPNERYADDPQLLAKEIQDNLRESCKNEKKPYEITVSIGYTRCADPKEFLSDCIKRADADLYVRKRDYHSKYKK